MPRRRLAYASLFAFAFAIVPPGTAMAQDTAGSGVLPGEAANTGERPLEFATTVPENAALAIVVGSAALQDGLPLSSEERAGIDAAIAAAGFEGKAGDILSLRGIGSRPRLVLVGVGEEPDAVDFASAGGKVAQETSGEKAPVAIAGLPDAQAVAEAALGHRLGGYRFDRYKTGAEEPPPAQAVTMVHADAAGARAAFEARQAGVAEGVRFARDLVNEPANVIYPETFVERTRAAFRDVASVEIEVLGPAAMRELGMGALLGVGQGSPRGPRLMLVTYRGAEGPPLALAGKGITFDTGGISLKTGSGMDEMKADMSGAAAAVRKVL
jgi:leucyl aminopeptidase